MKPKAGILLDVGCRNRKESNFVGIDDIMREGVDIMHPLEKFPYPLKADSCITIKAAHVVEHIKPWLFFHWFDEMWRLLRPGGQLAVSAPYANSQGFFNDPTHVTYINEATFQHLDPNYPMYQQHAPKPWKIEFANWSYGGNIEAILSKRSIADVSSLTLSHKAVMLGALQKPKELELLFAFLYGVDLKNILEIGTARGGTLWALCQIASKKANIISLDMPGGQYGAMDYIEGKEDLERLKDFASPEQKMHIIRQNSHSDSTFRKVKKILNQSKLDLLFIDGDHTYSGVKADWEMYSPLVREAGFIVFHDILDQDELYPGCKVDEFWKELKNQNETWEFIDPNGGVWGGIGIVKKKIAPRKMKDIPISPAVRGLIGMGVSKKIIRKSDLKGSVKGGAK